MYEVFTHSNLTWFALAAAVLVAMFLFAIIRRRQKKVAGIRRWLEESSSQERENYINELINGSGFLYDGNRDIFYAEKNPWQKEYGYSRLYDEMAATVGMIIDCEPIYFEYDGETWMLELWKGQYGMCLGGEIGLYRGMRADGSFFMGVDEEDYIGMQMELYVAGSHLLGRREEHWWLTGFALGKSGKPADMTMAVSLTFQDDRMCQSVVEGLRRAGYAASEYRVRGKNVRIRFGVPHTHQPVTRGPVRDTLWLWWFRMLCRLFLFYTKKYETSAEKLIYLQTKAPWLFGLAIRIGKGSRLFTADKGGESIE